MGVLRLVWHGNGEAPKTRARPPQSSLGVYPPLPEKDAVLLPTQGLTTDTWQTVTCC